MKRSVTALAKYKFEPCSWKTLKENEEQNSRKSLEEVQYKVHKWKISTQNGRQHAVKVQLSVVLSQTALTFSHKFPASVFLSPQMFPCPFLNVRPTFSSAFLASFLPPRLLVEWSLQGYLIVLCACTTSACFSILL